MPSEIERQRQQLIKELRNGPKASRSFPLQSYLGSPYPVLGLSTPTMRTIVSNFTKTHHELSIKEVNQLTDALWKGKSFEEKTLAISLLNRFHRILNEDTWKMTDRWIEQAKGWALCDSLGSGPISSMLQNDRKRFQEVLRWTRSENFWRRRISTYTLRDLVYSKDLKQPFTLLEKLLYDKEFWVQRAVGTWLRECWKQNRKMTESYLIKHANGLPRVTITVATERASKQFRERLRKIR
ncbi:MAG TPA: DNA alkylation repair protein [Terriglobales bacterium]|nr:DNA alkylation repair protein [Terriglobales bacterium]